MADFIKIAFGGIVGGLVGAIIALTAGAPAQPTPTALGSINHATSTITNPFAFTEGFAVGPTASTRSKVSNLQFGTCNLSQMSPGSFSATTTAVFYCAATGISAGDNVRVDLAAGAGVNSGGAGSPQGGFAAISAYATTTGILAVEIVNFTGAATTSFPQATTSAEYFFVR